MRSVVSLVLAAALTVAVPLHAQSEPERPDLPRGADPNDWTAYYDLGVRTLPLRPGRSAAAFYWASRLDPSRAEPLFGRWAAFFAGRLDLFERYVEDDHATRLRPEVIVADSLRWQATMRNPFVHRGLEALVLDQLPGVWSRSRETQGWLAYSEGKLDKAVRDFSRLIDANPGRSARFLHWRALAHVSALQNDSALADMQRLLRLLREEEGERLVGPDESREMVLYGIAMLHETRGRKGEATAALQDALVENAAFYPARAGLGRLALRDGRTTEAVEEYRQAVELAPDEGHLRLQYALALGAAGRHADALAELRRARELEPHYAEVHLHLAVSLDRNGLQEEAMGAYQAYLDRAPRGSAEQAARVRARLDTLREAAGAP